MPTLMKYVTLDNFKRKLMSVIGPNVMVGLYHKRPAQSVLIWEANIRKEGERGTTQKGK